MPGETPAEREHREWLEERARRRDRMFGLQGPLYECEYRKRELGIFVPRGTARGDDPEAGDR